MQEKLDSNYFRIGKIVNTHGLKGELKVVTTTHFVKDRFKKGNKIVMFFGKTMTELTIKGYRFNKQMLLLSADEVNNLTDAEKYKGKDLFIHQDQLHELGNDDFYIHQLVGCECTSTLGEYLGVIASVLETGAVDVLVIKNDNKKDLLVPFNKQFVPSVDIDKKHVEVFVMDGLR